MTRFDTAHLNAVLWEINKGPDRSVAIVWSSLLEDALRSAIERKMRQSLTKSKLKNIFENTSPLATFSARIRLAYAFEVVSKIEHDDLNVIRNIRNEFAHNLP
jgi:DNA-binding MltR family transcriptional regulator